MTTVVDPTGTPAPVYNKSGTTIVSVEAGHAPPPSGPPVPEPIPHQSERTISVVDLTNNEENAVELPSGADVGDVVEVYHSGETLLQVMAPSGETIDTTSGALFRKTDATTWRRIATFSE